MSLFEISIKAPASTENRPNIDLKNVQPSYHKIKIEHVAYINFEFNITDTLTKIRTSSIYWNLSRTDFLTVQFNNG